MELAATPSLVLAAILAFWVGSVRVRSVVEAAVVCVCVCLGLVKGIVGWVSDSKSVSGWFMECFVEPFRGVNLTLVQYFV